MTYIPRKLLKLSHIHNHCFLLSVSGYSLAPGVDVIDNTPASTPASPGSVPGSGGTSPAQGEGPPANAMATFREAAVRAGAPPEVAEFLQASFRRSSIQAYSSAWRQWLQWCQDNHLGHHSPTLGSLLSYLWHLYSKGRVYGSIGVHRSALASLCQPGSNPTIGAHPLVSRFMRAVYQSRPPAKLSLRPTWDVADVLQLLSGWDPPQDLDLLKLSHKTVTLVALESMRRISDLTLLDIGEGHMARSQDKIVFQLKFGLKQNRPGHSSPVVAFSRKQDPALCAFIHVTSYIDRVEDIRSTTTLFVTSTPPHQAAAKHTIRSWVVKVLQQAGIAQAAGSTRAAAATYAAASKVSLTSILSQGDWSRASTLFHHYIRHLPQSALQRMAQEVSQ